MRLSSEVLNTLSLLSKYHTTRWLKRRISNGREQAKSSCLFSSFSPRLAKTISAHSNSCYSVLSWFNSQGKTIAALTRDSMASLLPLSMLPVPATDTDSRERRIIIHSWLSQQDLWQQKEEPIFSLSWSHIDSLIALGWKTSFWNKSGVAHCYLLHRSVGHCWSSRAKRRASSLAQALSESGEQSCSKTIRLKNLGFSIRRLEYESRLFLYYAILPIEQGKERRPSESLKAERQTGSSSL